MVKDQDLRYVELNGETFAIWDPELTPEEERQLDAEVDEHRGYNSILQALREELGMTQDQLAVLLGVTQSNVSKMEKKLEPRLSAVRKLVEHRGGRLRLIAQFDGREMELPISLVAPVLRSKARSVSSKASSTGPRRKAR